MNMKTEEIAHTAIENLEPVLDLKAQWQPYVNAKRKVDGKLVLHYLDKKAIFDAIVKKELRTYLVDQIIQLAKEQGNLIVIAWEIFPALKEKLKEHRVNYLEANGNVFIKDQNLFLMVERAKKLEPAVQTGNRAITPTGLKVVFELLRDKNLINRTQRDIAEKAGVALGNIPKVLQGLKDTGQIYKLDKKKYAFHDRKELLQQWIKEYQNTLKPTLEIGRYTTKRTENWEKIPLNHKKTVWGGEPAADLLTNYLKPGVLTLYTEETKKDLMVNYGLMPDKEGTLFAYQKFWENGETDKTAPPILVYADLVMTNDKRCIETANILFNERIEPKL